MGPRTLATAHPIADAGTMWIDQRGSEVLPLSECVRLIALASKKGLLGRLAVSREGVPVVQPVNFVIHDRQVIVRLGPGTMASAVPGSFVAFEVDRVDEGAGSAWSVVVRGLAMPVTRSDQAGDSHPEPTPLVPISGDILFGIRLDVVTGRRFPLQKRPAPMQKPRHFSSPRIGSPVRPGAVSGRSR